MSQGSALNRRFFVLAAIACLAASCSKGGSDVTGDGDDADTPPSDVANLSVFDVTPTTVTLRWLAPSGGSPTQLAFAYDVRYAQTAITASSWASATQAPGAPAPRPPGMQESMLIARLSPGASYWFALKSRNAMGDWSQMSNVVPAVLPLEAVVAFPDTALEGCVRQALGKPTGDLLASELALLSELHADGLGISDLTGLEYCTGLTWLTLAENEIIDLTPIGGLIDLESLVLRGNQIADIGPIAGLVNMTGLILSDNQISNLHALAGMIHLEVLSLNANQITQITELGPLVRLTSLNLTQNQIQEILPLSGMPDLQYAILNSNRIISLLPLVANTGFGEGDRLEVAYNSLSDEAIQEQIPALQARGVTVVW